MVVVLPAPLGPISPQTSPGADLERQVVHGTEVVVIDPEVRGPGSSRTPSDRRYDPD